MRTLLSLLMVTVTTLVSSAQGLVTFQNSVIFSTPDPTGGDRLVYDMGSPLNPLTGVGLAGTQYVAELYVGANTGSLTPLTTSISHFRSTTSANKGKWAIGCPFLNCNVVLPGFDVGSTPTLQVRVWDLSLFS